jgi:hypothetical protein
MVMNRRINVAFFLTFLTASARAFIQSVTDHHQQSRFKKSIVVAPLHAAAVETPPSPLTVWGEKLTDIRKAQQEFKKQKLPEFAIELSAADVGLTSNDTQAHLAYFREHAMELKRKMQDHGAVVFRGFDLMKTQEGFQEFYKALGMNVCQDPLQSVSARPTADGKKDSPVYEAVNKESRKNFFIGTLVREKMSHNLFSCRK